MPSITQVMGRRAVLPVDVGGGVIVTIDYYPDRITATMAKDFFFIDRTVNPDGSEVTLDQATDRMEMISARLAELIHSWDLTEVDNVTMVPITKERLVELGLPFLMLVFGRIWGAIMLGERKGSPSAKRLNGTSRRKGR